jgi:hypothetical protein
MKKVYCCNCKYYTLWTIDCLHKTNADLYRDNVTGETRYRIWEFPSSLNSNGECKNYERKWWKFWVK